MDDESSLIRTLAYSAFAALGGLLGHFVRAVEKRQKIYLWRAVLEGVSAGFVGLLMLFLCDAMGLSKQWTGVIVGVSGWLGPSATIRLLELLVRRKLNLNSDQEGSK